MSRVIRLQSENIKKLRAIDVTPGRNVVLVGGKNGEGKSSTLDSIAMALGGGDEAPEMPIRRGETKAKIILELDDLTIRRTFTARDDGEVMSVLVVEAKDGARYPRPQDVLDRLTGKLTFDPLEFLLLAPAKRLEALMKLLGCDFTALDARRKQLYDERTLVNRTAAIATSKADFMPQHTDVPAEEQSVAGIAAELESASNYIRETDKLLSAHATSQKAVERDELAEKQLIEKIEIARRQVALFEKQLHDHRDTLTSTREGRDFAKAAAEKRDLVDLMPIKHRLSGAEAINLKVRQNLAHVEAVKAAQSIAASAKNLTDAIDSIDREKESLIAAATFPVPGLSFNATGVLFNAVPFDQASDAEKLRVSVAMGIALNPKLKVLLIRNASLLDEDSMALLTQLVTAADYQIWLELVSTDAGRCSVIIEDGAVKAPGPATFEPVPA